MPCARHFRGALVAVVLVLGLTACSGSSKETGVTMAVTIQNFSFSPNSLSANVGDTITVTDKDRAPHTFTADHGSFDTGTVSPGKSKAVRLAKAGTIAYHCTIHSSMQGTLYVR